MSTARQARSGPGLEARRQTIAAFANSRGAEVLARFTEVKSGPNPNRPELGKALHLAKATGATRVIAKLDRLSRNAAFLLPSHDSGAHFLAVDMPEANDLGKQLAVQPARKSQSRAGAPDCARSSSVDRGRSGESSFTQIKNAATRRSILAA